MTTSGSTMSDTTSLVVTFKDDERHTIRVTTVTQTQVVPAIVSTLLPQWIKGWFWASGEEGEEDDDGGVEEDEQDDKGEEEEEMEWDTTGATASTKDTPDGGNVSEDHQGDTEVALMRRLTRGLEESRMKFESRGFWELDVGEVPDHEDHYNADRIVRRFNSLKRLRRELLGDQDEYGGEEDEDGRLREDKRSSKGEEHAKGEMNKGTDRVEPFIPRFH